jgi:RAQPRD family integrative conjugative element protein
MPCRQRPIFGLMIGLALTPGVYADPDAEREALARIVHELQTVESLISKAQAQADNDVRVRFQYDWLRSDVTLMKDGIQSHIDAPRAQPRAFPPLRGDYRR